MSGRAIEPLAVAFAAPSALTLPGALACEGRLALAPPASGKLGRADVREERAPAEIAVITRA